MQSDKIFKSSNFHIRTQTGSHPEVLIGQESLFVAQPALTLLHRGQENLQDGGEAVSETASFTLISP